MPRGDKSKYTEKQKRQAEHIEEGYEQRGVGEDEAARRAWSTVNKMTGGAKKTGGSGQSGKTAERHAKDGVAGAASGAGIAKRSSGKAINTAPAKKGGKKGGAASAARPAAARSASAKKAAQTRARNKAGASASRSTAARSSAAR